MAKKIGFCKTTVRWNAYDLVQRAISEGIRCGLRRAKKHTSKPTEEDVIDNLEREVMTALCDIMDFDPPDEMETP